MSLCLSTAESEDKGEGVDEEEDPEGDDLAKEPHRAILLHVLALGSIVAEVGHVGDRVHYNTKEGVRHRDVPEQRQVGADANHSQQDRGSEPFDNVEDGEPLKGEVVDLGRLLWVGELALDVARKEPVSIRVEVDRGNAPNELS